MGLRCAMLNDPETGVVPRPSAKNQGSFFIPKPSQYIRDQIQTSSHDHRPALIQRQVQGLAETRSVIVAFEGDGAALTCSI